MIGSPQPGKVSIGNSHSALSKRSRIPTAEDVRDTAEKFYLSSGESLLEASKKRPITLVFLRHFGCTFTRQILRGLENLHQQSKDNGAELVLVHMLKDHRENRYLGGHDEVARISDPHCALYRSFGLGNGSILELFGPRVWWMGAISVFKGCGVGHLAGNAFQMPGAFLFQDGRIIASQRAKSASELPDLPGLFSDSPPLNPQ